MAALQLEACYHEPRTTFTWPMDIPLYRSKALLRVRGGAGAGGSFRLLCVFEG